MENSTNYELFRAQAIQAAGLSGHNKANELYAEAWEIGWAGGRDEVLCVLMDLAEIELGEEDETFTS